MSQIYILVINIPYLIQSQHAYNKHNRGLLIRHVNIGYLRYVYEIPNYAYTTLILSHSFAILDKIIIKLHVPGKARLIFN